MKIIVLFGSPRLSRSNSYRILTAFLQGAQAGGAEYEIIFLQKYRLAPCRGCMRCWLKQGGRCVINDDLDKIRARFLEADAFVLVSPIYLFSVSGLLKIALDRLFFPTAYPAFTLIRDRIYHPSLFPDKQWKACLLVNGAFDGADNFQPVIDMYRRLMENNINERGELNFLNSGEITIGFGMLLGDNSFSARFSPLFDRLCRAGKEFVSLAKITGETLNLVNAPVYEYAGLTREQAVVLTNSRLADLTGNGGYQFEIKSR